jgi:hypothetical protein
VKLRGTDGWTLDVPDNYPLQIMDLRAKVKDFDQGIKTILFGQGGTHIYVFQVGFQAYFEGTAKNIDHPLHKVSTSLFFPYRLDFICSKISRYC